MGWFSKTPVEPEPPARQDRQQCWDARDAYFACLDKLAVVTPGQEAGKCSGEEKKYQKNCAKSWIDYFNQRRVLAERQKGALAAQATATGVRKG